MPKMLLPDETVNAWARSVGIDPDTVPIDSYWRVDGKRGLLHYEVYARDESGALALDHRENPVRLDATVPLPDVDPWGRPVDAAWCQPWA